MSVLLYLSSAVGLAIFACLGLPALVLHLSLRSKGRKYPPGPPADPLIGHIRYIATEHPHLYYTELTKAYGSVSP